VRVLAKGKGFNRKERKGRGGTGERPTSQTFWQSFGLTKSYSAQASPFLSAYPPLLRKGMGAQPQGTGLAQSAIVLSSPPFAKVQAKAWTSTTECLIWLVTLDLRCRLLVVIPGVDQDNALVVFKPKVS
jgi:hypothetical protein